MTAYFFGLAAMPVKGADMKYCFGVIVDDRAGFNKVVKLIDDINAKMVEHYPEPDAEGNIGSPYYTLAGVTPAAPVETFAVIGANVPQAQKDKIQGDGGNALKGSRYMWFGGGTFTYATLKQRLHQWAGENSCTKIWYIDEDTDVTTPTPAALLAKFEDI